MFWGMSSPSGPYFCQSTHIHKKEHSIQNTSEFSPKSKDLFKHYLFTVCMPLLRQTHRKLNVRNPEHAQLFKLVLDYVCGFIHLTVLIPMVVCRVSSCPRAISKVNTLASINAMGHFNKLANCRGGAEHFRTATCCNINQPNTNQPLTIYE